MAIPTNYRLLDFGDGRRLEQFGSVTLDRPCPAAEPFVRSDPHAWTAADARFDGRDSQKGTWTDRNQLPDRWTVAFDAMQFELKRTDFGHVGLFPEQAENWAWIASRLSEWTGGGSAKQDADAQPQPLSQSEREGVPRVLNLFAYTGGSTLAAASAGAEVVHVDAAKNVVAWARRNADLSGFANAPVRWIAEDALKFVERELRRGNRYDAVILDPPSYGHGPHNEVWRLPDDLPRLLSRCRELTADRLAFMLLTCHTPGFEAEPLVELLDDAGFPASRAHVEAMPLSIRSIDGRSLPSGVVVRYSPQESSLALAVISNP